MPYTYTVTEEDAQRGYFETTVSLIVNADFDRPVDLFEEYSTITATADAAAPEADISSEPEESSKPAEASKPDDGKKGSNPVTGAALSFSAVTLAAAAALVIMRRKK